jgi:hypothetical protein
VLTVVSVGRTISSVRDFASMVPKRVSEGMDSVNRSIFLRDVYVSE